MENLVHELKQKNPKALEKLMDEYAGKVYFLLKRIVGIIATDEDLEEMVSDVFVAVWNDIEKYDAHRGTLETFIFIQARSIALTFKRNRQRKQEHLGTMSQVELDTIADTVTMHQAINQNHLLEKINQLIEDIKEPDKSFFVMKYYLYYDLKTIAISFDTSVKAVESSLYRTRQSLKNSLKKSS